MKVTIYGKPGCSYCEQAKTLCENKGIQYEYLTVGTDIQLEQLFERCGGPVRSVPQIFINSDGFSEYVGGYNQLKAKI